jgi:hypothetical protein
MDGEGLALKVESLRLVAKCLIRNIKYFNAQGGGSANE